MTWKIFPIVKFLTLFVALVLSVGLSAQNASTTADHQLRYRFFELGTFGGNNSVVNGGSVVVNSHNVVIGGADSAEPCPYARELPISPAFKWENGVKTRLPLLPGGCSGFAIAINDHDLIVGVADNGIIDPITGAPQIHAVAWRDGHILDLGTLGGGNSLAGSVNERGQIVGVAQIQEFDPYNFGMNFLNLPQSTKWRGFLWQDGVMHDLGTLGDGTEAAATGDLALNDRGDIAGYSFTSDVVNPDGIPTLDSFIWRNGRLHDLGTLGGTITQAFTMNSKSQIVGAATLPGDTIAHAFLWDRGQIHDLGSLGGSFANAGWVNDQGVALGAATLPGDDLLRVFIARHGTMRDLGTLDGDNCSDGSVINSKLQAVGHSFICGEDFDRGFVWQNGVMTDLNDFLPPSSNIVIGLAGYINNNGVISAPGRLPNGDTHAVVLIPCEKGERNCRAAHHRSRSRVQLSSKAPSSSTGGSTSVRDRILERMQRRRQAGFLKYPAR